MPPSQRKIGTVCALVVQALSPSWNDDQRGRERERERGGGGERGGERDLEGVGKEKMRVFVCVCVCVCVAWLVVHGSVAIHNNSFLWNEIMLCFAWVPLVIQTIVQANAEHINLTQHKTA